MAKKTEMTEEQKIFIRNHYQTKSINKIHNETGIDDRTIKKFMISENLTKRKIVEIGDRFNRLEVIEDAFREKTSYKAKCKCDCGVEKHINVGHLKMGAIKSCGCLNQENRKNRKGILRGSKYSSMAVCSLYSKYGKDFCEEWKIIPVFEKWLWENDYENKRFLRRIDKTLLFSPDNCVLEEKFIPTHLIGVKFNYKRKRIPHTKIGDKFGRLTVIGETFWTPEQTVVVECDCENKTIKAVKVSSLKIKDIVSCGCYHKDISKQAMESGKISELVLEKYGVDNYSKTPEFKIKSRATCLKRYGVDHYSKTDLSKSNSSKKLTKIFYTGETISEVAERTGYSYLHVSHLTSKYGDKIIDTLNKRYTSIETIIQGFLKEKNINFEIHKKIENYFADIFIPDYNLIIEVDGVYWHSDKCIEDKKYHVKKRKLYTDLGYTALFFREDEIIHNLHIVKSIINNKLGCSKRVFARKCLIKEVVENKDIFFQENHLMGKGAGRVYGLFYNDIMVCGMRCKNKGEFMEISRFCPLLNHTVVGGFTKLLSAAMKDFNKSVMTFIDRRYGDGAYLLDLGFVLKTTSVSFRWSKKTKTVHRMKFPKNSGYEQGWHKLWDCGQYKYIMELK